MPNTAVLLALATASCDWYSHPFKYQRPGTLRGPWRRILFSFLPSEAALCGTNHLSHSGNVCLKSEIWTCSWGKCDVRSVPAQNMMCPEQKHSNRTLVWEQEMSSVTQKGCRPGSKCRTMWLLKLGKVSSLSLVAVICSCSVNLVRDISGSPNQKQTACSWSTALLEPSTQNGAKGATFNQEGTIPITP